MAGTAQALAAVAKGGQGVVYMLNHLITGNSIQTSGGTFTAQDFAKEWKGGGKKLIEQHWRDTANQSTGHDAPTAEYDPSDDVEDRDAYYEQEFMQGKHEWIPTNMLGYVVEHAFHHKDPQWLYFAEALRIPTRIVVVFPEKVGASALTGHVGALYTYTQSSGKYRAVTKGQAKFHDALRALLTTYLNASKNDKLGYEQAFFKHVHEYYWQGIGYPTGLNAFSDCPYFYNSGVSQYSPWGSKMWEMAGKLKEGWDVWRVVARQVFESSLRSNQVTTSYFSVATASGKKFPGDDGDDGSK